MAPADQPVHFLDRVHRSANGAVAVGIVLEVRLEDRFQHELGGGLDHPIPDRRNAERSLASVRLRYEHPPHRIGPIRLRNQFLAGGSASALSLSRPAQASLTLRPAGLLNRLKRPLSRGSSPAGYPTEPLVSYQINRQLSGWNLPPLVIRAFGAHCQWPT